MGSAMKLYTSYWARVRNFPPNLVALSTVAFPPKWYNVGGVDKNGVISLHCTPLRPGPTCSGLCDGSCELASPKTCAFLREYRKQLDAIDFDAFIAKLLDLREELKIDFPNVEDFDFAFIFFEKWDRECSERWPVQEWIRAHGLEIEEWHS